MSTWPMSPSPEWDPAARLLTYEEAAVSIERPVVTVRRWVSERRLHVFATQGRVCYLLESEVLRVEAETRARIGKSARTK